MDVTLRDSTTQGPVGSTAAGPSESTIRNNRPRLRRIARRSAGERGQAILEFALVVPLLAALVLVFVSFGKAIYYYVELTNVASEGAREASVNLPNASTPLPGGGTNLTTYLCQQFGTGSELYKGSGTVTAAKVTLSYPDVGNQNVGEPVKVDVSTAYSWFPFMNLGTVTIDGSATERLEQPTTGNTQLTSGSGTCS